MADNKQTTGLRKRQQISQANKTMFIWVASAAVVVSFCLVIGQFLFRQAAFNIKIIDAKSKASSTLGENIDNAKKLQEEMNSLLVNVDLSSVKAKEDDSNFKVILDALPSTNDPITFATSLQRAIIPRSGAVLDSLEPPKVSVEGEEGGGEETQAADPNDPIEQTYMFTVLGNYEQIQNLLKDFERTIRPINVNTMSIEGNDSVLRAEFDVSTYYTNPKTLTLEKKAIKP
jgi:hypothetical protein